MFFTFLVFPRALFFAWRTYKSPGDLRDSSYFIVETGKIEGMCRWAYCPGRTRRTESHEMEGSLPKSENGRTRERVTIRSSARFEYCY